MSMVHTLTSGCYPLAVLYGNGNGTGPLLDRNTSAGE